MDPELAVWACEECGSPPAEPPKSDLSPDWATGKCSNLDCLSRKDKGSRRRPARQGVFRRVHEKA